MTNIWVPGSRIILNADTGTGKTHFIMHEFYDHCKINDKRTLVFENRKNLLRQLNADYSDRQDIFQFATYQSYENVIPSGESEEFSQYDYIVLDECHYFFSDSGFNHNTDIVLNHLLDNYNGCLIMLSATSEVMERYVQSYDPIIYRLPQISRFKGCYYWNNRMSVIQILRELPPTEKAIFFCSSASDAWEMHMEFESNSAFICSEDNKKYFKHTLKSTSDKIINESKFSEQILFTTIVLDNGINLIDGDIKHIIIDIYDLDTAIQCIGRVRDFGINNVSLYVKWFTEVDVDKRIRVCKKELDVCQIVENKDAKEFERRYSRSIPNIVYYDRNQDTLHFSVNKAKKTKLLYDVEVGERINARDLYHGHLQLLCEKLDIDFYTFQDLDRTITARYLFRYFEGIEDVPLFEKDKNNLFEEMKSWPVSPIGKRSKSCKLSTINKYLFDGYYPYFFVEGRDKRTLGSSPTAGKRYWELRYVEYGKA